MDGGSRGTRNRDIAPCQYVPRTSTLSRVLLKGIVTSAAESCLSVSLSPSMGMHCRTDCKTRSGRSRHYRRRPTIHAQPLVDRFPATQTSSPSRPTIRLFLRLSAWATLPSRRVVRPPILLFPLRSRQDYLLARCCGLIPATDRA
jgi:hypothetical protein